MQERAERGRWRKVLAQQPRVKRNPIDLTQAAQCPDKCLPPDRRADTNHVLPFYGFFCVGSPQPGRLILYLLTFFLARGPDGPVDADSKWHAT